MSNKIDSARYAHCSVRIPPPRVENAGAVLEAGLWHLAHAIVNGEDREVYALFLHDHRAGRLVCDGWLTTNAYGDSEAKNLAGLHIWMKDRGIAVMEGEQDAD